MRNVFLLTGVGLFYIVFALSSCAVREMAPPVAEKPTAPAVEAKEKAPEAKVKPIKAKGDIGLLDLEKNYMILVTKEGKLITVDFTDKTKVTKITPTPSKMGDIGLGSSASVEYQTKADKKIVTKIEYKPAKGGD
jgi:hypothetical protein